MSLKCKNLWAKYMPKGNFKVLIQAVAPCKAVYFAWVSFFSSSLWELNGVHFINFL